MRKQYILIFLITLFINSQLVIAFDFAPEIGDLAPDFQLNGINLNNKDKVEWKLNDFKNKWIILYFYPKDFTTGCTIEAKGFSKYKSKYEKYNAEIVGISADSKNSHDSFCDEKSINYTLLSDPEGEVSQKYGSWIPPYSDRNTFLISPKGRIIYRWISVMPINHAKDVLNTLKQKA